MNASEQPTPNFAFGRSNYVWLGVGIATLILGYALMSGGGSDDPNIFDESIFNFREIRYFDIEGKLTGLVSKAMTSPCGKIRIPLNESQDDKSAHAGGSKDNGESPEVGEIISLLLLRHDVLQVAHVRELTILVEDGAQKVNGEEQRA